MLLKLVTEARPIPPGQLSDKEQRLIDEANNWIKQVNEDAKRPRHDADGIDENRTGRVLFIDGPRGAGKTSFLLTLLKDWKDREKGTPSHIRVLLPILDFDPLPHGLAIHSWLLEPWRKEAKRLEKEHVADGDGDLSEALEEVVDRVITGWTRAAIDGMGLVEKTIAFQQQSSGWVETRALWHKFVNMAVCRSIRCSKEKCKAEHPFVFVVAVDDVDLQVEQVPQLLHALRLLHHPNVAYLITGNYDHLRFALELDYLDRHMHRTRARHHGDRLPHDDVWKDIGRNAMRHSKNLCDAFLEKALPSHARLTLPILSATEILKLTVGNASAVSEKLDVSWRKVFETAGDQLSIATARQVQHAIDRHLRSEGLVAIDDQAEFVAEVCGTHLEMYDSKVVRREGKPQFVLGGKLTTQSGAIIRSWEGDRLRVVLASQPSFSFVPDFQESEHRADDSANRALIVRLAVEAGHAASRALDWNPEAGVASTQVQWRPSSSKVDSTAIFHWPWLIRPPAREVLQFGEIGRRMNDAATSIVTLSLLPEPMVSIWLLANVGWRLQASKDEIPPLPPPDQESGDEKATPSLVEFSRQLKHLYDNASREIKQEVEDWALGLYVMTTPYFGIPTKLANDVRQSIKDSLPSEKLTLKKLSDEQGEIVKTAIIANGTTGDSDLSDKELDGLMVEFLSQRENRSESELWIKRIEPSA